MDVAAAMVVIAPVAVLASVVDVPVSRVVLVAAPTLV